MFGRKDYKLECLAMVVGVSIENGIEAYSIPPKSVNQWKYIHFLDKLRTKSPGEKIVIVTDNCRTHHARRVKNFY